MQKAFLTILLLIFITNFSIAGVSVLGGLARIITLAPGQGYEGTINLSNSDENPRQVKIYLTDYLFYADGRNLYGDPGAAERSNARWISLSPNYLTVPPHDVASVHYVIAVPESIELSGTYWSMLMVEPTADDEEEELKNQTGKIRVGLRTVIRYGIQIVTDIGDTGECMIRFSDQRIVIEEEKKFLQIDIDNIGERWLNPSVWVELYGDEGGSIGRFKGTQSMIFPGCSVRQMIELSDIPAGEYQALLVADNGDEYVFGAKYVLELKE